MQAILLSFSVHSGDHLEQKEGLHFQLLVELSSTQVSNMIYSHISVYLRSQIQMS